MARRISITITAWILGIVLAGPALAAQGWHIVLNNHDEDSTRTVDLRMEGANLWVSQTGQPHSAILGPESLTILDDTEKTYMTVTYAQLEATLGAMSQAMKSVSDSQKQAMKEAMKNMPPEQRAQVEKQLAALDDQGSQESEGKVEIQKAGDGGKIAGHDTEKLTATQDGKPSATLWVAKDIPVGPILDIIKRIGKIAPRSADVDTRFLTVLNTVTGFPMKVQDISGSDKGVEMEVTMAEKVELGDADFAPPAGYTQTQFPLGAPGGK